MTGYRATLEALDDLYETIPVVKCQGLCANECTSINMSDVERRRIRNNHGVDIPKPDMKNLGQPCPALREGRCTVYESRPYICRAYGATKGNTIECRHGCEVVGVPWNNTQVLQGLARSYAIGGGRMRTEAHEAMELILKVLAEHPESQRIIDMSMTPEGRRALLREQLNKTVFKPLPRGGI